MRILNLNDAGIKLISSDKKQIYLSIEEIKELLNHKYSLSENILRICDKQLVLSKDDIEQFDNTYGYIKNNFEQKVKAND